MDCVHEVLFLWLCEKCGQSSVNAFVDDGPTDVDVLLGGQIQDNGEIIEVNLFLDRLFRQNPKSYIVGIISVLLITL